MIVAELLAHAGGWDEAAFVGLPIALFGGLLAIANRRAQAEERRAAESATPDAGEDVMATPDLPGIDELGSTARGAGSASSPRSAW